MPRGAGNRPPSRRKAPLHLQQERVAMTDLSHLDDAGRARMVDVGAKPATERRATAEAVLRVGGDVMHAIPGEIKRITDHS